MVEMVAIMEVYSKAKPFNCVAHLGKGRPKWHNLGDVLEVRVQGSNKGAGKLQQPSATTLVPTTKIVAKKSKVVTY